MLIPLFMSFYLVSIFAQYLHSSMNRAYFSLWSLVLRLTSFKGNLTLIKLTLIKNELKYLLGFSDQKHSKNIYDIK